MKKELLQYSEDVGIALAGGQDPVHIAMALAFSLSKNLVPADYEGADVICVTVEAMSIDEFRKRGLEDKDGQ